MQYANILTGGIGSGKSTTARLLAMRGFSLIDVDMIAHSMLDSIKDEVIAYFGESVKKVEGDNISINRAQLGKIIFQDSEKKAYLESLLHPKIHAYTLEQCKILEERKSPYFVDLPLYFESKHHYPARFVICVYAPRELQIERICKRNNLTEEEAIKRVDSQMDIELKRQKSDFVIRNTSDINALYANVEKFVGNFFLHFMP